MISTAPRWKKVVQLPAKIVRRLRERGLRDMLGWCWYQFAWRAREWRLGIDTRESAHGVRDDREGLCNRYEPIEYRTFDIILDYLGDSPNEVFVDYGCGMGRAVVLAATRPMRRVIGVEIDTRLAEIARRQIQRAGERGRLRCANVEIVTENAVQWPLPDDVTCIFLFNSFTGSLLESVLEQIRNSLKRKFRPLKVVYVQPVCDRDTLVECAWLTRRAALSTGYWDHIRTIVYEAELEAFASPPEQALAASPASAREIHQSAN